MSCLQNAGNLEWTIDVTSSVGPWYVEDTQYAAGASYEIDSDSTPIGVPYYDYWYASIAVPSAGIYVLDDGYRNGVFMGYPGSPCRSVGTILPLTADM
jgi:hypothetical protein